MNPLLIHMFLVPAAVLCCAAVAIGQKEETASEHSGDLRRVLGERERERKMEEGEDLEWSNLTPEQRLERSVTHGASTHCRFIASCRPEKLLPGATGTMFITAVLQGAAVLPAPAPIELLPQQVQSAISVGPLSVRAAEPGKLAKAYEGRPVYDNYAILELPVAMSSEAKIGEKHVVAVDLKFDLYDGSSAQPVGRFIDRVSLEVEVGAAPDPVVKNMPRQAPAAGRPAAIAIDDGSSPPASGSGLDRAPVITGHDVTPAPVVQPPLASGGNEAGPSLEAADDGLPILPLAGGAGILALLILLLLRRK